LDATPEQIIKNTGFVRLIISLTTVLAFVSLLIKAWLYTYWLDYKSAKQYYLKLMDLQKVVSPQNSGELKPQIKKKDSS
jgi:hypothetical protein